MTKIIMEVGSIHDGSFGNAKKAISFAKRAGANYIKFQMHIAEAETTSYAPSPKYFQDENRFDYFKRTSFSIEQWRELIEFSKKEKLSFMVSPFSNQAVDILLKLGVKNFKVASGEVSNIPLLKKLDNNKLNVFLSTGMSDLYEIKKAVKNLNHCKNLVILQCTSLYPCPLEDVNLEVIPLLRKKFPDFEVGLSDHTLGSIAAIGAVFKGAKYIEKHFSFSRHMYGSDSQFGLEPNEFIGFVNSVREAEILNSGTNKKIISKKIKDMKKTFEKSLVYSRNLVEGTKITSKFIDFKKPGTGLKTSDIKKIIGKRIKKNVQKDMQVKISDLL